MTKPLPIWKRILFELAAAWPHFCTRRGLEYAVGVGTAVTERIRLDIRRRGYFVTTMRIIDGDSRRFGYKLGSYDAARVRASAEYREWARSQRGVTRVSS